MSKYGYTLVQHSGYARGGKGEFMHAVESMPLTSGDALRVLKAGGLIISEYAHAEDRAFAENYPPGVEGLVPKVKGTFSSTVIDGLKLYIPTRRTT